MAIEPLELPQIKTLAELAEKVAGCRRCRLAETRTNLVFGVGSPESDLVFIGEAPGYHEDKQGEPFVGAAGKLLDELLLTILGIHRRETYIANVLKCRPPGNRDPLPEEIASCRPYVEKQLELINPLVVCTLGNFATRLMLKRNIYISKVHGQPTSTGNYWVFPTYHPAAALYTRAKKETIAADFKKLAELLMELNQPQNLTDSGKEPASAEQLGLF